LSYREDILANGLQQRNRVQTAGLNAAKARGVQLGRPATINGRADEVRTLKAQGLGIRAIARQLGMPPSSVHKALQLAV
jgi:DNA invertase Pin-like site-specific DNA recombinase